MKTPAHRSRRKTTTASLTFQFADATRNSSFDLLVWIDGWAEHLLSIYQLWDVGHNEHWLVEMSSTAKQKRLKWQENDLARRCLTRCGKRSDGEGRERRRRRRRTARARRSRCCSPPSRSRELLKRCRQLDERRAHRRRRQLGQVRQSQRSQLKSETKPL